jgi:hypothetical protein
VSCCRCVCGDQHTNTAAATNTAAYITISVVITAPITGITTTAVAVIAIVSDDLVFRGHNLDHPGIVHDIALPATHFLPLRLRQRRSKIFIPTLSLSLSLLSLSLSLSFALGF